MNHYIRNLAFLFFLVISVTETSAHIRLYSFDELVADSEIIVVAKILSVRRPLFGYTYAIFSPLKFVKGQDKFRKMKIKYGQPFNYAKEDLTKLDSGNRYLMFLRSDGQNYWLVGATSGYYLLDKKDNVSSFEGDKITLNEFLRRIEHSLAIKPGNPPANKNLIREEDK